MKLHKYCFVAALLTLPSLAHGQAFASDASQKPATQTEPSPAALQLARELAIPRLGFMLGRTTPQEMKQWVKQQLLSSILVTRGPGCDPRNSECEAAAEAIAAKHAAEYAKAINDAIDRGHALLFDAKMTQAQIRATLNFVRTGPGKAFASTLSVTPKGDPELLARVFAHSKMPGAPLEEFFAATKDLPRAQIPIVPPVVPPPRPPRLNH